jgi:predicted alpha/beta superfamily hydrolase
MQNKRASLVPILVLYTIGTFVVGQTLGFSQETSDVITIGTKLSFHSERLKEDRLLLLYTPQGYENSDDLYPVLYLLDGEAHFHHTTGIVEFLANNDRIPDMIIVALPNPDRYRDLTPPLKRVDPADVNPSSGGADNFLAFLKEELIPYIDQTYRTRPYRLLVGHSLGGLFSIYTLVKQPGLFNGFIAISPSLWWDEEVLVGEAETALKNNPDMKGDLYMTIGNEKGKMLGAALKLSGVLEENATKNLRWHFEQMEQETHGSIPHRSTYDGLEKIFEGYYIHEPTFYYDHGGLDALDKNYKRVSERLGYTIPTPAYLINEIGYTLLERDRPEEAVGVFERQIKDNSSDADAYSGLGEAYFKLKNAELAKENYIKSLKLNPGNDDAKKRLTELGIDVSALIPDVVVSPDILIKYVGEYQGSGLLVRIFTEDKKLYGENLGTKYEFRPISETKFYLTILSAQITFNQNAEGVVEGLTIHMGGENSELKKIK